MTFEQEIWRPVIGNEGYYEVSNLGRVRSWKRTSVYSFTPRILSQHADTKGYMICKIGGKSKKVHRLVAEAFVENPLHRPQVNHKDGNKKNNIFSNLEWVTNSENQIHANKMGLNESRKAAHKKAVCKMVEQYDKSGNLIAVFESTCDAARRTGIWQSQISNCCLNKPHCKSAGGYKWRFSDGF